MASTRRLTAILAADVAGYSRLMGADEEGTHERLKAHLEQLINPRIAGHRGRIVKTTGDGILAEFASVVDAVRCATEIQRAMIDRDAQLSEERRIRLRIGINLGEQGVKNIARPVRVYALRPDSVADLPASSAPTASIPQPAAAPRLSIVVLPFANLSNDPEQQYFADGITEDLTTDLSRIDGS